MTIIGAMVRWSDRVMSYIDFTPARPTLTNEECLTYIYGINYECNPISVQLVWSN